MSETGFKCPHCGATIDHVLKVEGRNQYICPNCRQTIKAVEIPFDSIEIKPLRKKRKTETEEEWETEEPSIYERIRSPTEILVSVLKKYHLNPECIDLLKSKSELREGGLHPLELEQRLREFSKSFTGIKDKRLVKDIVEDYNMLLQKEYKKAKRRGISYIIPMDIIPPSDLQEPSVSYGAPMMYGYGYEDYGSKNYKPYGREYDRYYRPKPYGYGPREEHLTKEDVLKLLMEWERQREEKTKLDRLMELISKQQETIMRLQNEIKDLRENPPQAVPPNTITREEFEAYLEKRDKDAFQKYLEAKLQDTKEQLNRLLEMKEKADEKWEQRLKELQERYEKIIEKLEDKHEKETAELMKKIEEAKREASVMGYKSDEMRFRADVMKETRGIVQDILDRAPLRKTLQVTISPVQEKPPTYEEKKEASEHEEELLPPELVVEE